MLLYIGSRSFSLIFHPFLSKSLHKSLLLDKNDDIQKYEVERSCNEGTGKEDLTGNNAGNSDKIMKDNYLELCNFRLFELIFLEVGS